MPVRAIMPEEMEEQIAMAAGALMVETSLGMNCCSKRGKTIPITIAPDAYTSGMVHVFSLSRRGRVRFIGAHQLN
jgi:hypothetical protein